MLNNKAEELATKYSLHLPGTAPPADVAMESSPYCVPMTTQQSEPALQADLTQAGLWPLYGWLCEQQAWYNGLRVIRATALNSTEETRHGADVGTWLAFCLSKTMMSPLDLILWKDQVERQVNQVCICMNCR